MDDFVEEIKKEHIIIRKILSEMLSLVDSEDINVEDLKKKCHDLDVMWNIHEAKEDHFFNHLRAHKFPEERSIIEQHRELKGHWKVLNDSLKRGDESEIKITIDTDGRMLAEKFINHMAKEEAYFEKLKSDPKLKDY